jgi:hypothetical protein
LATKDRRISAFTKKILGATDAMKARSARADAQFAEELAAGELKQAAGKLADHAKFEARLAMGEVLQGHDAGWEKIERFAYLAVIECIANPFALDPFGIAVPAAYMVYLEEQALAKRYLELAAADKQRGLRPTSVAGNFVATLAERARGEKGGPKRPMGVYEGIFESWSKPKELAKAVAAACEHHLEGIGQGDNIGEFERIPLVPVEIAALRPVRAKEGLELPDVDHPLLQTPLAKIPSKRTYDRAKDERLERFLEAARRENPDLGL